MSGVSHDVIKPVTSSRDVGLNNEDSAVANPQIHNVNVADQRVLISPAALRDMIEVPEALYDFVPASRKTIEQIIDRQDHRLMVVVGPCSIHDVDAALDYANRLKALSVRVAENLYLFMRGYFEKPRTTVGWKGLINDPNLDDSFEIQSGLQIGRTLLRDILALGLPTATEALDPITPQYLHDLISWSAVGARTTESQTHREMASGLSSPIGFKNGTDGGLAVTPTPRRIRHCSPLWHAMWVSRLQMAIAPLSG
jgi:3-deoxy-7-phosphoheptulonate synthase